MRQLVTGGAGFLGYHLARRLAGEGHEVHLVDNLSRGRLDRDMQALLEHPNLSFIQADLTDPGTLTRLEGGYDGVYHLAAIIGVANVMERPQQVLAVNARTLLNLLDWYAAGNARRLFFASTSEAYAWTMTFHELPIPTPEDVPLAVDRVGNRRASYALSKVFGEMAVVHTCQSAGKPYTIARYHNVYGPRMGMQHVIPEMYRRIYDRQAPLVVYSVDHRRAFCYVDDAVEATLGLMAPEVPSEVYNIGNDAAEVTIGNLAREMLAWAGRPDTEIAARESSAPGIARRCPDIGRLRRTVGFTPRFSLHAGLEPTLSWYREFFEREGRELAGTRRAAATEGA
ncbi:MAG: NAD-dependent epimerase/dehydratase family protein [Gemmatimonadales bacterium]